MQNISFNKSILALTIILFALVAALAAMFGLSDNSVPVVSPIVKTNIAQVVNSNVYDLNNFESDLIQLAKDDAILSELDATLTDVGDIGGSSVSVAGDEKNINDLEADLNSLSSEESVNSQIDQVLKEMAL